MNAVTARIRHEAERRTKVSRILSQNVQAIPLMSKEKVRHDVNLSIKQAGVIGWQEIKPDYYDNAIHDLEDSELWESYWGYGGVNEKHPKVEKGDIKGSETGVLCPISWKTTQWEFVAGGKWLLHDGRAGMMENRHVVWVLLRHKKTGGLSIFFNLHFVAGAWSDKKDPRKQERREVWRDGYRTLLAGLRDLMERFPDAAVCGMGDWNANLARDSEEFMPRKVKGENMRFTHTRRIDHLVFINGDKWKWTVLDEETAEGRYSDHQGALAHAQLTRT